MDDEYGGWEEALMAFLENAMVYLVAAVLAAVVIIVILALLGPVIGNVFSNQIGLGF